MPHSAKHTFGYREVCSPALARFAGYFVTKGRLVSVQNDGKLNGFFLASVFGSVKQSVYIVFDHGNGIFILTRQIEHPGGFFGSWKPAFFDDIPVHDI